ncbi:glycosyltransferase family 22 protein [Mixia osmundae IAM 14324]|uniref:Mannosyltransferase n=1 Tax=Mixia osmundae (strain CBS 9802 / IAM 14324 / JCM 22182 / KY 12970) TaxID=764103 RepID=G7E2Q7_MIXOS|nr:glycosyltransferase family 22 protein [Mixia osmundae IAM 14324]KEI36134.1 glycosyltransferase family 22 protein [Mixia osmundae IAM 14324]GAA97117.1 hypothetical protein E5Q_03792 [Mixia osmundae IAM 14324]
MPVSIFSAALAKMLHLVFIFSLWALLGATSPPDDKETLPLSIARPSRHWRRHKQAKSHHERLEKQMRFDSPQTHAFEWPEPISSTASAETSGSTRMAICDTGMPRMLMGRKVQRKASHACSVTKSPAPLDATSAELTPVPAPRVPGFLYFQLDSETIKPVVLSSNYTDQPRIPFLLSAAHDATQVYMVTQSVDASEAARADPWRAQTVQLRLPVLLMPNRTTYQACVTFVSAQINSFSLLPCNTIDPALQRAQTFRFEEFKLSPSAAERNSQTMNVFSQAGKVDAYDLDSHTATLMAVAALRVANALLCQTFFQPDEYYQTLEVAHRLVYGYGVKTWEWQASALRSPLLPLIYTLPYGLLRLLRLDHVNLLLVGLPKVLNGLIALAADYGTYELSLRLLGPRRADAALLCSLVSFFNASVTIRSLSNSAETAVTALALSLWPWQALAGSTDAEGLDLALALAAVACIMRPAATLFWLALGLHLFWRSSTKLYVAVVASAIATVSVVACVAIDSLFYQHLVFTPLNFVRLNVSEGLSSFYGVNSWHFYISQALPLLCWALLPFVLAGFFTKSGNALEHHAIRSLSLASTAAVLAYSCLAHKEIRFVQPLLPFIHLLASRAVSSPTGKTRAHQHIACSITLPWPTRIALISLSLGPALYTLLVHGRGQIAVMSYLNSLPPDELKSVGFLMPCHSTPWQSHLHRSHLEIAALGGSGLAGRAWYLTCEPPLSGQDQRSYKDQSDFFYEDPITYLKRRFPYPPNDEFPPSLLPDVRSLQAKFKTSGDLGWRHEWPTHFVLFESLLNSTANLAWQFQHKHYVPVKRFFNSHVHEDPRRRGDILVLQYRKDA